MRQTTSAAQTMIGNRARTDVRPDDQHRVARGVINAMILSLVIWFAAGYLIFFRP